MWSIPDTRRPSLCSSWTYLFHDIALPFYQWGVDMILGPFPLAHGQLNYLIVGVNYFTKWIEAEFFAKIILERLHMCRFRFSIVIVSDKGTQISSTTTTYFCCELGVQTKFISVIHAQVNGLAELANKVILKEHKNKFDDAKGLWAELLHEILWSYHTTPYSTNKDIPFSMVFKHTLCFFVEIVTPS